MIVYHHDKAFLILANTVASRKRGHGWSTLQVRRREGWAPFECMFPQLTTKERPCHVYSDLMPSKQITGQTITYMAIHTYLEILYPNYRMISEHYTYIVGLLTSIHLSWSAWQFCTYISTKKAQHRWCRQFTFNSVHKMMHNKGKNNKICDPLSENPALLANIEFE